MSVDRVGWIAMAGLLALPGLMNADEPEPVEPLQRTAAARSRAAQTLGMAGGSACTVIAISDGTFEGDWTAWTTQTSTNFGSPLCTVSGCGTGGIGPYAGNGWAWFGGAPPNLAEAATLGQNLVLPVSGLLELRFQMRRNEGDIYSLSDTLAVSIAGSTVQTFSMTEDDSYTLRSIDITSFATGASQALLFTYQGDSILEAASFHVDNVELYSCPVPSSTATPTSTPSPTATATASPTRTASATPSATPSASATATPTPTASATASASATPTPTATPSATATPTLTRTPTATATPTASATPGTGTLDVDGVGGALPLTDGLLLLRYFFGFRDATLVTGAVGAGCSRCTADAIETHIASILGSLDIDGVGGALPLTDGLLLLRYFFGFRDATLVTGAVGAGCTRCTAEAIETYIASLL